MFHSQRLVRIIMYFVIIALLLVVCFFFTRPYSISVYLIIDSFRLSCFFLRSLVHSFIIILFMIIFASRQYNNRFSF